MYVIFFSSLPCNEYWGFSWEYISQGMKVTTHLHLVPGLRMSANTLLLSLYAFKTCIESLYSVFNIIITIGTNTWSLNLLGTCNMQEVMRWTCIYYRMHKHVPRFLSDSSTDTENYVQILAPPANMPQNQTWCN